MDRACHLAGRRRHATLEDLDNLQKLNHMASSVHVAGGPIVEPVDVPAPHRHLHMALSALTLSDKPIVGNVTARERAEDTVEMLKLVFGEERATTNSGMRKAPGTPPPRASKRRSAGSHATCRPPSTPRSTRRSATS